MSSLSTNSLAIHRAARTAPWLLGCRRPSCWPRFTARRVELSLTCRGVARSLTSLGARTSFETVSWWERRGHRPNEDRLELLPQVLAVDFETVLEMFALRMVSGG